MAVKPMMSNRATARTRGLNSPLLASMSARRYQPDLKLMAMGMTKSRPTGMPIRNCLNIFFCLERFCSQYWTKSFSSCVSMNVIIGQRYAVFRRKFFIFSPSQNPFVVKLPQLLSQFLYQAKKLDLPGIGSFTLDPNVVIPADADKDLQTLASGISFKNTLIREPDDALVTFIKDHTGKMKPLAAADLDFFLTSGKQLLNIGKPFFLEGIGVLTQNKEGKQDFMPGEYSRVKLEETEAEKRERAGSKAVLEESHPSHRSHHEQQPKSNTMRQVVLLTVIIGGLIIIGWGGYSLYK